MYVMFVHGWLLLSCPAHDILYSTSLDLQCTSVPMSHTSQVGSLHPFFLKGFDFVNVDFTVLPDLSTTFTLNPPFLNAFLHDSARILSGVDSTKNTASDPSLAYQFFFFSFFASFLSLLCQFLLLYSGCIFSWFSLSFHRISFSPSCTHLLVPSLCSLNIAFCG